ncbi:MAG: helix-turn-helix domain-containing protein [Candidatus Ornithomonoglobus sp.]
MDLKCIKYGSHRVGNDTDGYMYSFNISDGYNFNSHLHSCYEFVHIIKGQLLYTVEGSDYMLSDGDIIMTRPEELHSFSFPKQCEYEREFLHIYPRFLKDFPEVSQVLESRKSGCLNHIPAEKAKKYRLTEIFRAIREYCENPLPETELMVMTLSVQLILKINRILTDDAPEYTNVISDKKTNLIYDYIDNHYFEDITAASVAEAMYMSHAYASRLFKQKTGMTIKAYINMRRINNAKNLIMEGQKATSIFTQCGFKDYSTFYRAFTKYVGMTPDKFRHRNDKRNN